MSRLELNQAIKHYQTVSRIRILIEDSCSKGSDKQRAIKSALFAAIRELHTEAEDVLQEFRTKKVRNYVTELSHLAEAAEKVWEFYKQVE